MTVLHREPFGDKHEILFVDSDPGAGGGEGALLNSVAFGIDGSRYFKNSADPTDWLRKDGGKHDTDVAFNNGHRSGSGSDHAAVAANSAHAVRGDNPHVVSAVQVGAIPTAAGGAQVDGFGLIGKRTIIEADALTPAFGWMFEAADGGTPSAGSSSVLIPGDLAEFNGLSWIKTVDAVSGAPPAGTVALVAGAGIALFAPLAGGDEGKIATYPGASSTPALESPVGGAIVSTRTGVLLQTILIYHAALVVWAGVLVPNPMLGDGLSPDGFYRIALDLDGPTLTKSVTGIRLAEELVTAWNVPAGANTGQTIEASVVVAGAQAAASSISAFATRSAGHAGDDADAEYVSHRFKTPNKNGSPCEFIAAVFEDGHDITMDFGPCSSGKNLWVFKPGVVNAMKWEDDTQPTPVQLFLLDTTVDDVKFALTGSLGLGTSSEFGSGKGVVGIKNAATVPSTNPTGGGVMYTEGGALKYRGSSGTVTVIAVA